MGNHYNTFIVWGGFACGWWDFEREEEIVLLKLEMRCLKSYPNQLFVACNIFGVRYEKKRKEHLTPHRAGGKCWIKSATSEKCLDIAITPPHYHYWHYFDITKLPYQKQYPRHLLQKPPKVKVSLMSWFQDLWWSSTIFRMNMTESCLFVNWRGVYDECPSYDGFSSYDVCLAHKMVYSHHMMDIHH